MKLNIKSRSKEILAAFIISLVAYVLILILPREIIVDNLIEAIIIGGIGITAGYYSFTFRSIDKNFKKFKFYIFLAYTVFLFHSIARINFLFTHTDIELITTVHFKKFASIHLSSILKFVTFILEFIAFVYFYKFLEIKEDVKLRINVFMGGFISYFCLSIIVSIIAKSGAILVIGLFLGVAIGIISLYFFIPSARFLATLLILNSLIHIWEGYVKATSGLIHSHILNPIYYFINILYLLEFINWVKYEKDISE